MISRKPSLSPACELVPKVSLPWISDVWVYDQWLSAVCCSQGSGKMVGGHFFHLHAVSPFEAVTISGGMLGSSFYI